MPVRRTRVGQWLRPFAFTLVLVIGVSTTYYLVHVKGQETYFTKRNFRHLAAIASQIEAQVNNVPAILKSVTSSSEKDEIENRLALSQTVGSPKFVDVPGLDDDEARYVPQGAGSIGFAYKLKEEVDGKNGIVVETQIASLVGDPDPAGIFDDVFIADGDFEVLYQKDRSEVHLSRFSKIRAVGKETDDLDLDLQNFGGASRRVRVDLGGDQYWLFLQPILLDIKAPAAAAGTSDGDGAETGGGSPADQERWIAGGLVRTSAFEARSFQISFTLIVGIAFLLLIGLLAWPFLKIAWLGPFERFSRSDLVFLTLCGLLAAGVLTVLILDVQAYRSLRDEVDEDLEAQSDVVLTRFYQELDLALGQIDASVGRMGAQVRQVVWDPEHRPIRVGSLLASPRIELKPEPYGSQPSPEIEYYGFQQLVWMNGKEGLPAKGLRAGDQLVKWSVNKIPTAAGNYHDRAYFRDAMSRRLVYPRFSCIRETSACAIGEWGVRPHFTISSILSRTTGERNFIVSVPVAMVDETGDGDAPEEREAVQIIDEADAQEPDGVVILSSSFESLTTPLPDGLSFLVVDDGGEILARAAGTTGRESNFLQELDDPSDLESYLFAKNEAALTVQYRGRPHRAFVRPMTGLPWHLVVLADSTQISTINLEIVASTLLTFGMYLVALGIGAVLFRLVTRWRILAWLWPDPARTPRAARCAVVLGGLSAAALAWAWAWLGDYKESTTAALAAVGLPLTALALIALEMPDHARHRARIAFRAGVALGTLGLVGYALFGSPPAALLAVAVFAGLWGFYWWAFVRGAVRVGLRYRIAYLGLGCTLLLLVASLPAGLMFHDAFLQATEALSRAREIEFSRAVAAQRTRIREAYEPVELSEVARNALERAIRNLPCLPYGPQVADGPRVAGLARLDGWRMNLPRGVECYGERRSERPDRLSSLVQARFPVYNRVSRDLRGLETRDVSSSAARWTRTDYVLRPVPDAPSTSWWAMLFVSLAIVAAIVVLLLRAVLDMVMGLNVESAPRRDAARFLPLMSDSVFARSRILYQVPAPERAEFFRAQTETRILHRDLRLLPVSTPAAEWIPKEQVDGIGAIVLENLDHRLDEPAFAHAALEALEYLLFAIRKPVLVFSEINPLFYLRARATEIQSAEPEREADSAQGEKAATPSPAADLTRWAAVMEELVPHRSEGAIEPKFLEPIRRPDLAALLRRQCSVHPSLVPIAERLSRRAGIEEWSQTQILDQFRREAEPLFHRLWALSTREEKFELVQIAREELVNPRSWDVARGLERRRLVRRAPAPRIASESLRWFLLQSPRRKEIESWETGAPSMWSVARVPLFVLLAVVTAFFFYTQQDLFDNAVGFLAAASAGLPLLLRLASMVQLRRGA